MVNKNDVGDFVELGDSKDIGAEGEQHQVLRVRLPKGKEVIGMVIQRLGGNRLSIKTVNGKITNCRVPGRFRRHLWLRPRDIVLIIPWEYDESKGDIVYKYRKTEIINLKKKGLIESLNEEF